MITVEDIDGDVSPAGFEDENNIYKNPRPKEWIIIPQKCSNLIPRQANLEQWLKAEPAVSEGSNVYLPASHLRIPPQLHTNTPAHAYMSGAHSAHFIHTDTLLV